MKKNHIFLILLGFICPFLISCDKDNEPDIDKTKPTEQKPYVLNFEVIERYSYYTIDTVEVIITYPSGYYNDKVVFTTKVPYVNQKFSVTLPKSIGNEYMKNLTDYGYPYWSSENQLSNPKARIGFFEITIDAYSEGWHVGRIYCETPQYNSFELVYAQQSFVVKNTHYANHIQPTQVYNQGWNFVYKRNNGTNYFTEVVLNDDTELRWYYSY